MPRASYLTKRKCKPILESIRKAIEYLQDENLTPRSRCELAAYSLRVAEADIAYFSGETKVPPSQQLEEQQ